MKVQSVKFIVVGSCFQQGEGLIHSKKVPSLKTDRCLNCRTLLVVVVFAEVHAELVAGGADLLAVGAGVLRQPGQVPRLHVVLQGRQVALGPIRDEH